MRVLRVIASMNPRSGGPCQGIRNSVPAVERYGHFTEVVSLDSPEADFLKDPFPVHALGDRRGAWGYNGELFRWLHDRVRRFDAVIVHGLWLYPSFAVSRAVTRLKREGMKVPPYFVMPHGMLDPWFQRTRPVKAIRNTIYWKMIEHRVLERAHAVLFTSEEERRLARLPFKPYRPRHEIVVGYGIADPVGDSQRLERKFRERFPVVGERRFLLFLSRVDPKKGVDLLLRAYSQIAKNLQLGGTRQAVYDSTAISKLPVLVIAGPCAENGYKEFLRKLANSLGLNWTDVVDTMGIPARSGSSSDASVIWLPMLNGEEKWGAFHACDAFALPSHQENFGIAVVEAMACGKPVLISDKVNIWREIELDGAGFVASDDVTGTTELLGRWMVLSEPEKLEMRKRARRSFRERFEIQKSAKCLTQTLERYVCNDPGVR